MKSVSSLLSRNPHPGTTIALPPIDSIVKVYSTTLPKRSVTVRFVVVPGPRSVVVTFAAPGSARLPSNGYGSPGATGLFAACVGLMSARRAAANPSESSPRSGTS